MARLEREKYLLAEEFKRILDAHGASADVRTLAMIAVGGLLGLRIIEVVGIRHGDLLLDDNPAIIKILTAKKKGKVTSRLRMDDVAVPKTALDALNAYLATLPASERQPHVRVFPFTTRHAYRLFKTACAKTGLPNRYSPHSLRHYRAVDLYARTKDINFVKESLRHASIASTQVYVHTVDALQKASKMDVE